MRHGEEIDLWFREERKDTSETGLSGTGLTWEERDWTDLG